MLYLDGHIIDPGQARIDPRDRGFLLGDGLFETVRAEGGRVIFLDRHLDRLEAGAAVLGIPLPQPRDEIAAACRAVLEADRLTDESAALRITLSRGPGFRGITPPAEPAPTLLIAAFPLPIAPPPPARAVISAIRRNDRSPLSGIKSLNYLDSVLALRDARERGADEAILCNTAGRLACASAANLFLVREGALLTPPPGEGILPGVTRDAVTELALDLGLACEERKLPPSALADAEEAFLTNSLIGVRPIISVDGRPVGAGEAGPVTRRLAAALAKDSRRS